MYVPLRLIPKRATTKKHVYTYKMNGNNTALLRVDDGTHVAETMIDADVINRLKQKATRLYVIRNSCDYLYIHVSYGAGRKRPLTHFILGADLDTSQYVVDHINGDTLDNRRSNLRIVDRASNQRNRKFNHVNKTGYRGVRKRNNGKWAALIHLGEFVTPEQAAMAYREAYEKLFPGVLRQE